MSSINYNSDFIFRIQTLNSVHTPIRRGSLQKEQKKCSKAVTANAGPETITLSINEYINKGEAYYIIHGRGQDFKNT